MGRSMAAVISILNSLSVASMLVVTSSLNSLKLISMKKFPPEAKSWRIIPAKRTTTGNRENFDEAGCGVLLKSECLR